MHLSVRIARLATAAIILASLAATAVRAQDQTATVAVSPASRSVSSSSDEFTVDIVVADVTNLGAFDFVLSFDQDVLEPVSVDKGDFLGSSGREVLCPRPPTIEPGAVRLECLTLRELPAGADGAGTLAIVTFKPKNEGSTRLSLTRVRLLPPDPDAGDIAATAVDGELKVEGGGGLSAMWLAVGIGVPLVLLVAVGAVAFARSRSRRFGAPRPDTLPE